MRPLLLAMTCLLAAMSLSAVSDSITKVTPVENGRIDVVAENGSLFAAAEAIGMKLSVPVVVDQQVDRSLTIRLTGVTPLAALKRIAAACSLEVVTEDGHLVLRDPKEPRVTLDVEDEESRLILESLRRQCGIRNLMIDPGVSGKGTFLFRDVPCGVAIRTVLESLSLDGTLEPSSILRVTPKQ